MLTFPPAVVTFDCYSALVDSRRRIAAAFEALIRRRRWRAKPEELATDWDRRNKALQRDTDAYVPFTELARRAMAATQQHFGLAGDARAASARDIRGATQADLEVIRVVRPGHDLDSEGPAPRHSVEDLRDLAGLLP